MLTRLNSFRVKGTFYSPGWDHMGCVVDWVRPGDCEMRKGRALLPFPNFRAGLRHANRRGRKRRKSRSQKPGLGRCETFGQNGPKFSSERKKLIGCSYECHITNYECGVRWSGCGGAGGGKGTASKLEQSSAGNVTARLPSRPGVSPMRGYSKADGVMADVEREVAGCVWGLAHFAFASCFSSPI